MSDDEVLTPAESVCVGAITGAVEVTANLPLWTIKTRVQCGLPFLLQPAILYRGYSAALTVSTLITATQLLNSKLIEHKLSDKQLPPTSSQRIAAAFLGGAFSSILFGPIDLVGTQYHEHNYNSYGHAVKETVRKLGVRGLFIGTPATALADGMFVCGFYGCYPLIKNKIDAKIHHPIYSGLIAAVTTGVAAATASHIPDMIKTMQQQHAHTKPKSMKDCFFDLAYKKGGVGFFKGYVPRTVWLVSAVGIAGAAAQAAETMMVKIRKS